MGWVNGFVWMERRASVLVGGCWWGAGVVCRRGGIVGGVGWVGGCVGVCVGACVCSGRGAWVSGHINHPHQLGRVDQETEVISSLSNRCSYFAQHTLSLINISEPTRQVEI